MDLTQLKQNFKDELLKHYSNKDTVNTYVSDAFFLENRGEEIGIDLQKIISDGVIPDFFVRKLEDHFVATYCNYKNPHNYALFLKSALQLLLDFVGGKELTEPHMPTTDENELIEDNIDFLTMINDVMEQIRCDYISYGFVTERDFEWTVQKLLWGMIKKANLPYMVFNSYPIEPGTHRSTSVDLIIVKEGTSYKDVENGESQAELVVEFKFEPSGKRAEICNEKLPVVFWKDGVMKDIERVSRFFNDNKAKVALAVFVDEGGRYRNHNPGSQSEWIDLGDYGTDEYNVSILWTVFCH